MREIERKGKQGSEWLRSGPRADEAGPGWLGSLPPASELAELEKILPGCANRLLRVVEQERANSQELRLRAVKAHVTVCCLRLALALIGMVAAYLLTMSRQDGVAVVPGGATSEAAKIMRFCRTTAGQLKAAS